MRHKAGGAALIAFCAALVVGLAVQAAGEAKQVSGTVAFICPQHRAIKVTCAGGKSWTLWVDQDADNAGTIKQQIGQLKLEESVTVSYTVRDGRNYITTLKKNA